MRKIVLLLPAVAVALMLASAAAQPTPATVFFGDVIAPTLSACGTSPSVSGNHSAATITVGTGTATSCTVSFGFSYTNAANSVPVCVITSEMSLGVPLYLSAKSVTGFTVTTSTGVNLAGGKFDFLCVGGQAPRP